MSQLGSNLPHDTQLSPMMFGEEPDRRCSPRIPLLAPVKIGPPQGAPHSRVSASDLSARGMFVDADRPVKVGTRFSAEIPLSDGRRIYVAEAEVAYNRERSHGSGFGAKFVTLSEEARVALAAEIARMTMPNAQMSAISARPIPASPVLSELPTMVPSAVGPASEPSLGSFDVPIASEPALGAQLDPREVIDRLVADELSDAPEPAPRIPWGQRWRELRVQALEHARLTPRIWTAMAATGGFVVVLAVGLTLASDGAQAVEPVEAGSGGQVSADTHQVLMGKKPVDALAGQAPGREETKSRARKPPKKPLPPLVILEKPAGDKAPVKAVRSEQKRARRPVPSSPKARTTDHTIELTIDPDAQVLRTHVLKKPDRFVVDLSEQSARPSLLAQSKMVEKMRTGRHPDHLRLVFDLKGPILTGRVTKRSDRLVVELHPE